MEIWLVRLESTGQGWHTCVCASFNGVLTVLKAHGIDVRLYGTETSEFAAYQSSKDKSQTASIMRQRLIP
jgi:hypothetical protein